MTSSVGEQKLHTLDAMLINALKTHNVFDGYLLGSAMYSWASYHIIDGPDSEIDIRVAEIDTMRKLVEGCIRE